MALGSVSIATFTRAEFENMLKKAMYSEGKLVWSATVNASSTTNVPDEVDYIAITVSDSSVKVARGFSAQWTSTTYINSRPYTVYHTAKFSGEGTLTLSWSSSANISSGGTYRLTGYHYY